MDFGDAIVPPHHQSSGVNSRSRVNWYGRPPRRHSDHRTSATTSGTSMPTTVTGASRSVARAAFGGRYPKRQIPVPAAGRSSSSQAATADAARGECPGAGGTPGARSGRGGIDGGRAGPAGRGTGFACVPRASCVPSLSIAPAP